MLDYDTVAKSQRLPTSEIDVGRLYSAALNRWPLVLATAVLGGLVGVGFSLITPPTFQAAAELSIGIDHDRVELLDEQAERRILLRVQDFLLSDVVLASAIDRLPPALGSQGNSADSASMREGVKLTRIDAKWTLAVTDPVPEQAAALANAWAESSIEMLSEAQVHAWRAAELQTLFFQVSCRPDDDSGLWICDMRGEEAPSLDLEQDLLQEVQASYGISPALSFALLERATEPDRSETTRRGILAVAGSILGLLVGFGLAVQTSNRNFPELNEGELGTEHTAALDAKDEGQQ